MLIILTTFSDIISPGQRIGIPGGYTYTIFALILPYKELSFIIILSYPFLSPSFKAFAILIKASFLKSAIFTFISAFLIDEVLLNIL